MLLGLPLLAIMLTNEPAALKPVVPAALVQAFREGFAGQLKDYPAVRVKHAYDALAQDYDGSVLVSFCLWANTKNGLGAYTGYHWFFTSYDKARHKFVMLDDYTARNACTPFPYPNSYDYAADFAPDHVPALD